MNQGHEGRGSLQNVLPAANLLDRLELRDDRTNMIVEEVCHFPVHPAALTASISEIWPREDALHGSAGSAARATPRVKLLLLMNETEPPPIQPAFLVSLVECVFAVVSSIYRLLLETEEDVLEEAAGASSSAAAFLDKDTQTWC
eukprot:s6264_g1.t1